MRANIPLSLIALCTTVNAVPRLIESYPHSYDTGVALLSRNHLEPASFSTTEELWKRKGARGGGRSGGGGGKSGGSSGSSGDGGSSSGTGKTSGKTTPGSRSSSPSYGGHYYGGGASTAYSSGSRSPSGISPIYYPRYPYFPTPWLFPVYCYPYTHPYSFYNESSDKNETKPLTCLCQEYAECGCDENNDSTFMHDLIGNGSYTALDQTLVTVANVNGTDTILTNGTLPNGTEAADSSNSASGLALKGYWVMTTIVGCTFFLV
jgi:hypothetical protein